MNKFYILFLICLLPVLSFAQKRKKQEFSFAQVRQVHVDGQLTDWQEKMTNEESELWSYGVTVNGNKLFIAVRVNDEALQREALSGGIFVNVSYSEKKKEGARLLYPSIDREQWRALLDDDQLIESTLMRDLLGRVRGYQVVGFDKVRDGLLSFDNSYGIRAVALINEEGVLTYEAEIPLHLIKFEQDNVAIQVGVNTRYFRAKRAVVPNNSPNNVRVYGAPRNTTVLKDPYKEETVVWFLGNIK